MAPPLGHARFRGARTCLAALLAVVAAVALPARGAAEIDRGPVRTAVFVIGDRAPVASATAETVRITLEAALASHRGLDVIDVDVALMAGRGKSPLDDLDRALAAFDTGHQALREDRLKEAVSELRRAEPLLARVVAFAEPETLPRLTLALGAALLATGDIEAADAAFERAAVMAPNLALAELGERKGVAAAWTRAKRRVGKRGTAAIEIDSSPSGALAYVDGVFVGFTPTQVGNLAIGTHHVSVRRGGFARKMKAVELSRGVNETVALTLEPSPQRTIIDSKAAEAGAEVASPTGPSAIRDLAVAVGAEEIVLMVVPKMAGKAPTYRAYLYDGTSARKLGETSGRADDFDVEAVFSGMAKRLYANAAAKQALVTTEENGPVYTRWWFWTGVAVAAAVTIPLIIYTSRDEDSVCPAGQTCGQIVLEF